MDTTHLAYTAEDLISQRLMRGGILVAKPKFDRDGTDLLGFLQMADGVKFCRIQCKGRNVQDSDTNIKIPEAYVSNGFVVFLYVEDGSENGKLFCFLANAIREWPINNSGEYQLSISRTTFEGKLAIHSFDSAKIILIRSLIEQAEASGEFHRLVYGKGAPAAQDSSVRGEGGVSK